MGIMISGETRLAGLIGGMNIKNSLSPFIHNFIADKLGNNMVYLAFSMDSDDLGAAVKGAYALGIKGLNVTAPFKVAAMEFAVSVCDTAREIGAVNLLKYSAEQGGYVGYNTDVDGFLGALEYYEVKNIDSVVIKGAGGAAKAAAYALKNLGISNVRLVRRGESCRFWQEYPQSSDIDGRCLLVQAASASPNELLEFAPVKNLVNFKTVFDMNYPAENIWLDKIKKLGIKAFDGKVMLIFQAVKAYEIIWDVKIPSCIINKLIGELQVNSLR